MSFIQAQRSFWLILFTILAFGCGNHADKTGSGSGTSKNGKLKANAGSDLILSLGDEALLDGSASAPKSEIERFYWLKV